MKDTLPQTLQDYFDIAWKHAVIDKQPKAINPRSTLCSYRTPDGRKCLIGAAIRDEHYAAHLEGLIASEFINSLNRSMDLQFSYGNPPKINHLQRIHDGCPVDSYPGLIAERLTLFASLNDLSIPSDS